MKHKGHKGPPGNHKAPHLETGLLDAAYMLARFIAGGESTVRFVMSIGVPAVRVDVSLR